MQNLIESVEKAIQTAYYISEEPKFGSKEAKAAIVATIQWLKEKENQDILAFLFPAIELLEEELNK